VIVNTGRNITDLFIDLSGGDRWLDHHGIAMGTTSRCNPQPSTEGADCGPLPSGQELDVALRALPDGEREPLDAERRGVELAVDWRAGWL